MTPFTIFVLLLCCILNENTAFCNYILGAYCDFFCDDDVFRQRPTLDIHTFAIWHLLDKMVWKIVKKINLHNDKIEQDQMSAKEQQKQKCKKERINTTLPLSFYCLALHPSSILRDFGKQFINVAHHVYTEEMDANTGEKRKKYKLNRITNKYKYNQILKLLKKIQTKASYAIFEANYTFDTTQR